MDQRRINVELGDRSYPIIAGSEMTSKFSDVCRQYGISDSVVVIADQNAARLHLRPLVKNLIQNKFKPLVIKIPSGETQKSLNKANEIFTEMLRKRIPRNAAVIAFGGGVTGDLAGFVAATYHRGINLVQVPTTLLAQVDSSIGGKVGVNHALGKNMIGAFHQPVFVWMDASYLKTLPAREMICGIGEVIKYGIIRDPELFRFLESHFEQVLQFEDSALVKVQSACAAIKADIVAQDEKEKGIRAILNYGHTIGHGLESAGKYKLLKHGEAVLFGMIGEAFIAKKMNLLDTGSFNRIVSVIGKAPVKIKLSSLNVPDIIDAIGRDKKRIAKRIRLVLPVRVGEVKIIEDADPNLIKSAVKEVLSIK